jgi:hypothetical protein
VTPLKLDISLADTVWGEAQLSTIRTYLHKQSSRRLTRQGKQLYNTASLSNFISIELKSFSSGYNLRAGHRLYNRTKCPLLVKVILKTLLELEHSFRSVTHTSDIFNSRGNIAGPVQNLNHVVQVQAATDDKIEIMSQMALIEDLDPARSGRVFLVEDNLTRYSGFVLPHVPPRQPIYPVPVVSSRGFVAWLSSWRISDKSMPSKMGLRPHTPSQGCQWYSPAHPTTILSP